MTETHGGGDDVSQALVDAILRDWPSMAAKAARWQIDRYGMPDEATASRLLWTRPHGPWKWTTVYRDEIPHRFPKPHVDVLEQAIDYRVPPDKADELAAFDGSVILERTKGEISARCDKEEMNFLALNLAHDIVVGRRSVDDARRAYTEQAAAWMMGRQDDAYTQGLTFEPPQGPTEDPDEVTLDDVAAEKLKEKLGQAKDALTG